MSKKVLFYLVLDLIGIPLTALTGKYLCEMSDAVTNPWVSNGITIVINFLCACVCIFIIFFKENKLSSQEGFLIINSKVSVDEEG